MLTFDERARLESSLPTSYDVEWNGTTYSYDFETRWEDEDDTESYPETILGWSKRGVEKSEAQSIGRVTSIDERPGEGLREYTYATRLYDELAVKCLVEDTTNSDGVPPRRRVEAFVETLWSHFNYRFDQNSVGSNGERPVVVRISKEPVHNTDTDSSGTAVQEYEFSVRVHYTDRYTETVDATQDVQYTIETN